MAEYRVEELAHRAGTSVRNVRVYQDRGLLAPPRRQGRVGYYSDEHLERLRLIGRLLERGYTFATIGELLAAWSEGGGLRRVLGLSHAIGGSWTDEPPGHVTEPQLRRAFGVEDVAEFVERAIELGVLEPDGAGFRVPSPHLLEAGVDLVTAGVPIPVVLEMAAALREHLDGVADLFFRSVSTHLPAVAEALAEAMTPSPDDVGVDDARAAQIVSGLRPHALRAVEAMFGVAMQARAEHAVQNLAGQPPADRQRAG